MVRQPQAARLDAGPLRPVARDRPPPPFPLFLGFRLYLLCAPDGLPIGFELAPANVPEREVAAEILRRFEPEDYTVICDKGFSGEELEELVRSLGGRLVWPDRKDEESRFGCVRQWIESIVDTLKGQLSLERHGGRTLFGVVARVAQRLLVFGACVWHNWQIGEPGRHLTGYDH